MDKEYIEREAAISAVRKAWAKGLEPTQYIEDIPTADVVEVVRCKDCRYYNEDCMSPHSGWCECLERAEYNEHFCSYGERRDGE